MDGLGEIAPPQRPAPELAQQSVIPGGIGAAAQQIVILLGGAQENTVLDGPSPEAEAGLSLLEQPLGIAEGQPAAQQPGKDHAVGAAAPDHRVRPGNQLAAAPLLRRIVGPEHIRRANVVPPAQRLPLLLHLYRLNEIKMMIRQRVQIPTDPRLMVIEIIRYEYDRREDRRLP